CAIHRAMQCRREDRIGRAKRQMFGLCNEGCACVVDENVERRFAPDRIHHRIHRGTVANVAADRRDLAAALAPHLGGRLLQHLDPAAADDELGTELKEAPSHRSTKPRAAAGDENALSSEQIFFEHLFAPSEADALSPESSTVTASEAKQSRDVVTKTVRIAS